MNPYILLETTLRMAICEERIRRIVGEEFEKLVNGNTSSRDPSIMDRYVH